MTVPITAPTIVAQLAAQLAASASWIAEGGTAADIYYPDQPNESITLAAVIIHTARGVSRPFVGVTLPSGSLSIDLFRTHTGADGTDDFGEIEQLAINVADEICTDLGIENLTVSDIGEASPPDDAQSVTSNLRIITITLDYGLES